MKADLFSVVDEGAVQAVPFVTVEVPCFPRGKGRPRGRMVKPRAAPAFIQFYTDSDTVEYENMLAGYARRAMAGKNILSGPLAVRVFAMMPIAQSWTNREKDAALVGTKFHMTTPDTDNIFKSVADAFNGVVYHDDKQIVRHYCHKEYAERPGIIAEIFKLP